MAEGLSGELEPVYLTLADIIELHALIIGATAAEAADQLRNGAGLERDRRGLKPMPTTRTQIWRSKPPSLRMGSQRASSSSMGTSAQR